MTRGRCVPGIANSLLVLLAATLMAGPAGLTAAEEQFPRGLLNAPLRGCTIETQGVSFGEYDTTARRPVDERGQVTYSCSSDDNSLRNIRIEISRGFSGSYDRSMTGLNDRLKYNLFLDATHQTVWGDGSGGTEYYFDANPPNRRSVRVSVYGRIPEAQDVSAGQYVDVVVVRVLF